MPFISKILSFHLFALSLLLCLFHVPSARNIPTSPPAYQHPFDVQFAGTRSGMNLRTELLTLSTTPLRGHRDYFHWIIKLFSDFDPGE